jgi:RNA polymerase sigma factor (sigma-70 family)
MEAARLIGGLARIVRDLGAAEELAQDAFLTALEQWPDTGIPRNPGAWLMAAAKHRAIDLVRRDKMIRRRLDDFGHELQGRQDTSAGDETPSVSDDLLRLIFTACHPVLSREARLALTLRVVGGLTTDEIARALLLSEATIAQRIVRSKRTLAEKRVGFELPTEADLPDRLPSVLEAIYLIFNEGYSATQGDDLMRRSLLEEALRLGRVLVELVPNQSEAHALIALMEIQASRARARVGPSGEIIRLFDQDRARWDQLLIRRGLAAFERSTQLSAELGPYALEAAIAACHARARTPDETDWPRIVQLYTRLALLTQSPVVELNRAVAVSMAFGPQAGLDLVDALTIEPTLKAYYLLPSVRGDLLAKLGRTEEARREFARAAALTKNMRERGFLMDRAQRC